MEHLRSIKNRTSRPWLVEEVKAGFVKFNELYGRFPTALEIDTFEYLPTSRSLQRSFGGLVKVRQELFPLEIANYTSGEYRKTIASQTWQRAQDYEEAFLETLLKHFHQIAIHEHKIIRPGRIASDFYIYTNVDKGVCLDLFYAKDLFSAAGVVNYKSRRYGKLECPVVFVLIHDGSITQLLLDKAINSKRNALPSHIKVMTAEYFWQEYIPIVKQSSVYSVS